MRFVVALLSIIASPAAFAADDDERPPKLLSVDEAKEQRLLKQSRREALAAVSLVSAGGVLELGGFASFLGVILSHAEPQVRCAGCQPTMDATDARMRAVAGPAMLVMGSVGMVALVAGTVYAIRARAHARAASDHVISAATMTWRF